jgi:hypothetical protein
MSSGGITPGTGPEVCRCDFGTVGFAICYDAYFDELRTKYAEVEPDMLLFSSMAHYGPILNYWAFSCRTYLVAAIAKMEPSHVINPVGKTVLESTIHRSFLTATINLDFRVVQRWGNRHGLAAAKARYGRGISIHDSENGLLGQVVLSSEMEDKSAADIVEEFGISVMSKELQEAREARNSCRSSASASCRRSCRKRGRRAIHVSNRRLVMKRTVFLAFAPAVFVPARKSSGSSSPHPL